MCKIENEKKKLRKEYKSIRCRLENKKEKSNEIFNKVIITEAFKESKFIAIYKNIESEVDTNELIKYSLKIGKIMCLPKVEENELKFYKINSICENLEKSKFGIEEPKGEKENLVDNNLIDLVIVPGGMF